MTRRAVSLLTGFFMCGAAVGVAAAQEQPGPPAGGPRIELSATEWNFGEVWQGDPLEYKLTVKNVGDAPLAIDVKSSCGCTVVTPPRSPLPAGESDTLTVRYDSVKRREAAHQTVTFNTNDPVRPAVVFVVRGFVKPVYDIKPLASISFGRIYRDTKESRSVEITNRYTDKMTLKLDEQESSGPYAYELKEIEPGMRYELTAATKTPLEVGTARGRIVLRTGIERLPEIEVLIYGSVQPPIVVFPSRLFLPKNSVSPTDYVLRVACAPHAPVRVVGARATHEAIKVRVRDVAPDDPKREAPASAPGKEAHPPDLPGQEIAVTLPPGDQIPASAEPAIEIVTDSRDPAYAKVIVPIRVVLPHTAGRDENKQGDKDGAKDKP